ncbi:Ankyrin repeat domain-containing protein 39 [Trebouxia sp. C0010 RCD-2024]
MNGVAHRRNSHSYMVPTFLTAEVALAAQEGEIARVCKWLNEGGPIDARDVFQCSLLHLASASGQVYVVRELLRRGASLNERSPDAHFTMGKTALHRACEEGHTQVVELLVAAGADTQMACTATGPAQKQAKLGCRSQAPMQCSVSSESKSARDLCKDNAVRLALEQPAWSPGCHHMWPARFKAVVQLLLFLFTSRKRNNKENEGVTQYCPFSTFSLSRRISKSSTKASNASEKDTSALHLDWDTLQQIISRLAYPVSQWCDCPSTPKMDAAAGKGTCARRKRRP